MADGREVWRYIQSLSEEDRNWLFARLADWPAFQRFLQARRHTHGGWAGHATIVFDGGSRGNPGPGYGSYALRFDEGMPQVRHLAFQVDMTNNEAEYEALIQALQGLRRRLSAMGHDPRQYDVTVLGDSQLVINQVTGVWKARDPRMLQRRDRVRELLPSFGHVVFEKRRREEIEDVLGH
jgi:ribonuclease HI